MSTPANVSSNDGGFKLPEWLDSKLFEQLLKDTVEGFKSITDFKASPALSAGENYATVLLRVEIIVELEDGKTKTFSYMIKLPHDIPMSQEMLKAHNIFAVETGMYLDVVPEFEQMYRDAGVDIRFGPQCYKLVTPQEHNYVLLEDLRSRGFKNANRLEGLDLEHTQSVLKKLALWHAASATRIETKGKYKDLYSLGFFLESQRPIFEAISMSMGEAFLKCLKSYENHENYIHFVESIQANYTDEVYKLAKVDSNDFNVLCHGDCWSNNVMFQYDAFGKIKETYLIDYQLPKYGSPVFDLFYFIISSTKLELKIKQFEYFIKFYYDHLIENLQLLKFPKKLPTLKSLHIALYKYGFMGYVTATGVMGAVLLDPSELANISNFIGEGEGSGDLKQLMYSNPRYRKHIEAVLPWLHNRGALEL